MSRDSEGHLGNYKDYMDSNPYGGPETAYYLLFFKTCPDMERFSIHVMEIMECDKIDQVISLHSGEFVVKLWLRII